VAELYFENQNTLASSVLWAGCKKESGEVISFGKQTQKCKTNTNKNKTTYIGSTVPARKTTTGDGLIHNVIRHQEECLEL
jgi:hypothetical protein